MKSIYSSLLLILLVISTGQSQRRNNRGASPLAQTDSVWTSLSPEHCGRARRLGDDHFRACPPVGGYQLLYGGNEASPQIIIVGQNRKRHTIHYWNLTANNFIGLEKRVSWAVARSRNGKITARALMLTVNLKPDEFSRFPGPYTILAKLTPTEVCVVARVPSGPHSAETLAGAGVWAVDKKCVGPDDLGEKDWLGKVIGLAGKGLFEEAKSVVKRISSPGTRAFAYTEIARAQSESGDQPAARATLLLGLNEVLNQKDESIYFNAYGTEVHESTRDHNLISLLAAMAAVGLNHDVNDNLRFVNNSDLPRALIWIGKAQGASRSTGGRGDHEAANATFKRAVHLELMRTDTAAADSNLLSIVKAQVEVGLLEEAKQTVLLIKSPGVRAAAVRAISWSN